MQGSHLKKFFGETIDTDTCDVKMRSSRKISIDKEERMRNVIYAITGSRLMGKTTLVQEMLRVFPNDLAVVRTTTTQPRLPGSPDDDLYRFVSDTEFHARLVAPTKDFIAHLSYQNCRYGTDRRDVESVFAAGRQGIQEINANLDGISATRLAGYEVVEIHLTANPDPTPVRGANVRIPEHEILTSFEPGGLARSIAFLTVIIANDLKNRAK